MMIVRDWIESAIGTPINKIDADIGIEIEVEGQNLPAIVGDSWRVDRDGSLRGESYEYVSTPIKYKDLDDTLDQLKKAYRSARSTVHESIRAGVHVHRNVQEFTPVQLFNLSISYFALEDLLMKWAGENREGNHFCLRAKDGEFVLFQLQRVADTRSLKHLNTDTIRYCSLNLFSLFKYGTVEFRGMRGTSDLGAIKLWTEMVYSLTENSKKFLDPLDIIMSMSGNGEDAFLKTLLPEHHSLLSFPGYESTIRDSVRRLQFIANSTNWSEFEGKIKLVKTKASAQLKQANMEQILFDLQAQVAMPPAVGGGGGRVRGRQQRVNLAPPLPEGWPQPGNFAVFDEMEDLPDGA